MAYTTVLSNIPASFTAGDSLSWKISLSDYLASASWTLSYAFIMSGAIVEIASAADGDDHLIELPAATTAAYTAGTYSWQAYVTKGVERYAVDHGTIEILPNFATQESGFDNRTHAKKALDALEAVIENRATVDQLQYSIAGRQIMKMPPGDLIEWHAHFSSICVREKRQERRRRGQATGALIKTRFSN